VKTLEALRPDDRADVLAALAAVETADAPVSGTVFPSLADPALRHVVAELLDTGGRELIAHDEGWLSAYRDDIADRLVAEGLGVLAPKDRAVLTLVLLHTVAIPRARGRIEGDDWTQAEPTTFEELRHNRHLTDADLRRSVRTLRAMGVLRPGHRPHIAPGPQFLRLTAARKSRLWEELVLLCRPEGMLAQVIRRRRSAAAEGDGDA
jgi:hypothetical protein